MYGDEKRPAYLSKEVEKFQQFGLVAEELDLRNYFDDNSRLAKKLAEYGAVWVMGGNSFVLRRAMQYSNFDKIITPLVQNDSIVYAGFSAGSVVASKTLKGIELVDDPQQIPPNYSDEIVWEGLGFVDFSIAPHYESDHPESTAIDKVVAYFEESDMPYKAISDGQAIVIAGDQIDIAD
jgi:dipeptidase E